MGTISVAQVDPRVASFLEKPRKMLINGNWVDAVSGKTFPATILLPARCSPRSQKATAPISILP